MAKVTHSKRTFPTWLKPTLSMLLGGTVGLIGSALLPDGARPLAVGAGIVGSKLIGGGTWGKYLGTGTVVAGLMFLGQRKYVQVAHASLSAAKKSLASGGGGGGGGGGALSPAEAKAKADAILKK